MNVNEHMNHTKQKQNKDAIIFSSEDSLNTDNSFNSSIEEDNAEDYKQPFFSLKEQMAQFFLQNPGLNDEIKFDNEFSDEDNKHENMQNKEQSSKLWSAISKDIVKNGQFGSKVPTLETVNHRLNLFKKKIERVDYLNILAKQNTKQEKKDEDKAKQQKQQEQQPQKRVQSEDQNSNLQVSSEIQYVSFKKQQQQKMREQLKNDSNKQNQSLNNNSRLRSADYKQTQRKLVGEGRLFKKPNQQDDQKEEQKQEDKNIEFKTRVGQALYLTLQTNGGDREQFKKTASIILADYNQNKKTRYKVKNFPPQINKFTSEETKHLNIYLPDFSNPLQPPNKSNIFQGIENYQPPEGSVEADFFQIIDRIIEGKVLQHWRESHNNI